MPDAVNFNLTTLTPVERLRLWRVRKGVTQWDLADRVGLTRRQIQYVEDGNRPDEAERILKRLRAHGEPLTDWEICLLCRWRSGLSTAALAKKLKTSRPTLLKWELTGDNTLLAYWRAKGYRLSLCK